MYERADIVIVGGGIAGGALATVLARAGIATLVLERTTVYRDRVLGEWMAPWGVREAKRLGLHDVLVAAGAHHVAKHVTYGPEIDPEQAFANPMKFADVTPDVPGPLTLQHIVACDALRRAAIDAGATFLRGVTDIGMATDGEPSVTFTHEGVQRRTACRIIAGCDGRGSIVRARAGIELHRDPTHHFFAGLLVENAHGWPEDTEAIGTEGEVRALAFPQGNGRVRLYLGYSRDETQRLAGPEGPQRFLDLFRLQSLHCSEHLANATPAGPCNSYPNEDTWTDEPYAPGVVLVGDAAGYNDPLIGQGLSITMRDVRIVSDLMLGSDEWSPALFAPYGKERAERMRRLRFVASLVATMQVEFGSDAEQRRKIWVERAQTDPTLMQPLLASLLGPDALPPAIFEPEMRERVLGAAPV